MNTVEQAITEIVLTQVAAAEMRIIERLSLKKIDHLLLVKHVIISICQSTHFVIFARTNGYLSGQSERRAQSHQGIYLDLIVWING